VPESKSPKKPAATPQPTAKKQQGNPAWLVPTMLTLMIVGLVWIVTTYITQTQWPVPGIGNFNLLVGFALLFAGFALTLRWR
jgi:uncharacterized membrane protein